MSKRKVLLGLIGTNIVGSLSPALFADAFLAAGIEGFYHLMDVDRLPERRLAKLLDAAKATGFAGTNITYPFKQEVIALLDAVGPGGRTDRRGQYRRDWAGRPDHWLQFRSARLAQEL